MTPNSSSDAAGSSCRVVGIGASAGGLESLEAFFHAVPPGTGMAFVVIQHLSPDFRSVMDELIARFTPLPVRRAEDGVAVEPDRVYVLPPGKEMIVADGRLRLTDKDPSQPLTLPIDHFFRSLAHDCGPRAAAIVMSGSGSDGSRGVRDVHEAGGLVLAEPEESARFDGMPGSARRSGAVDRAMRPEEMPKALLQWAAGSAAVEEADEAVPALPALDEVLTLLRRDYDVDFSHYKPSTVVRRIDRRQSIVGAPSLEEYVEILRRDAGELRALYGDLLIGVTAFFRDPHCFQRLQSLLPRIVASKRPNDEVRIWVAGCATGEEAYSLAMLADEAIRESGRPIGLKVFATDVNAGLLEAAGRGVYAADRLANVEADRFARYFVQRENGYQVAQGLRQAMVFAAHNVLRDAPFTNMDVITCRNLLIYLQPQAQKKALLVFHFGLRAGGVLFLGSSESPAGLDEEFETVDSHCRLYTKRRDVRLAADFRLPVPGGRRRPAASTPDAGGANGTAALLRAYDGLLDRFMPPGFLVSDRRELLDSFAGAEKYLRVGARRPSGDLLDLLPRDLRTPLTGMFQRVAAGGEVVRLANIPVRTAEGVEHLRLSVEPLTGPRVTGTYYLVTLAPEERRVVVQEEPALDAPAAASPDHLESVENELRYTRDTLEATIEELESSNEELQATNEELVASNEELQSTNEELHSVNEELYTVNAEYQRKIQELSELNRDMNHLLEATDVATLFLDRDLHVRRFTPRIAGIFDLVAADVGRPIASFTPHINHPALLDEMRGVLEDGQPRDREVRGDGRVYLLRLLPYRNGESIEGVVLSLVDVTVLQDARRDLSRLSAIVQSTDDAIIGKSPAGIITSWNAGAERLYGFAAEEAIGRPVWLCVPPERRAETEEALNRVLRGERLAEYETVRLRKNGEAFEVSVRVSPVLDETGAVVGASSISRDITERKRAERRLQAEHAVARLAAEATSFEETAPRLTEALREALDVDVVEFFVPAADGRLAPVAVTHAGAPLAPVGDLGETAVSSVIDTSWAEQARQAGRAAWFADAAGRAPGAIPDAAVQLGFRSGIAFPVVRGDDCLAVIVIYCRDPHPPAPGLLATVAAIGQTVGQLIRRGHAETELRNDVIRRDRFLAMLSHELRNPLAAARAAVIALQRNHLDRGGRHAAYAVIGRQVQHMSHLLDDLLDVARVTQDRLKLQRERFDLGLALAAAVEMVSPAATERRVEVDVEAFEAPTFVSADRARITQMVGNLLTNAVKYSPPGSRVRLSAARDGGEAVIRVVDQGVGMSREVLDRAFDLFYQADETLDRRQSGMGVGLTLARTIASLHGGSLSASSPGPGLGSTFEARLPLASPVVEEAPEQLPTNGRSYRIVLVEDHEDNREMIRLLLGCEGHLVDVAANGAEGASLIERVKPDVALVDIGLPGIDGFTVAKRIRENRALDGVGLIALSGYAQEADVEHARKSGFDAHVAKPMTPDHLLEVVASVVKEKGQE